MSVLTVQPTLDTIVELKDMVDYYVVSVEWEYDVARYVMSAPCRAPIAIDFEPFIRALPRDEGFVITAVHAL